MDSLDDSNENKDLESNGIIDIKIAVLGKSLVGKSALTFRFIKDEFPKEHETSIEEQYKINSTIDGYNCRLEILDTAGQDDFQTMLENWINFATGFLLVYSIDDPDSFNRIKTIYESIVKVKEKEMFCCIIVGNKCDLSDGSRKVSVEEAEQYARSIGMPFVESSSLHKINVKESFIKLAHDILERSQARKKVNVFGKVCGCNII